MNNMALKAKMENSVNKGTHIIHIKVYVSV